MENIILPNSFHFNSVRFSGIKSGLNLVVLGAVHGNEICGTQAIEKIINELNIKKKVITSGSVTFIPITNPLAYYKKQRMGDRNLNRNLNPSLNPKYFEDYVANWLCPLLSEHNVLLDLHSFHSPGSPFALIGPTNNIGQLEPFKFAKQEEELALKLGVNVFVDGWLDTYARGVEHRCANKNNYPKNSQLQNLDVHYGMGTTEFIRSKGGYGITLECGQHNDLSAPEVAYQAIINSLVHLGLMDGSLPKNMSNYQCLRIIEVIDKLHEGDYFSQEWKSFDHVKAGQVIGTRHNGEKVFTKGDVKIMFPNTQALPGNEWFYLAEHSYRF